MDTAPIFDYLKTLDFTQKSVNEVADVCEPDDIITADDTTNQQLSYALFIEGLLKKKRDFEECLFQAVAESSSFREQLPIIAKKLEENIRRYNEYKGHETLSLTLNKEDDILCQFAEDSLRFLNENYLSTFVVQLPKKQKVSDKPAEPTVYQKKLEEYGEFLSVKDLMSIFKCTDRTIYSWEKKGYIHNISETTNEINCVGRRKRGQEKRFSKEAVLKNLTLQEKFNSL